MLIILVFSILVLLLVILFFIPGFTPRIKDSSGRHIPGSIASLEKITLGGVKQWILLRGADTKNPVVLFLHGGPGTADMNLLRRHTSELEKHFVVVSWDQRGAGKSFAAGTPNSSMKISQFISDAHELTEMLCKRFKQKKIILAGHSWGSVLGTLTAQKYPELFHAYIGIGQIANIFENEKLSYEWTLEQAMKANDKSSVETLKNMGTPPYTGRWQKKFMTQRRLLGKFGGEFYNSNKGAFPVVFSCLLRSTEYTVFDKVNFFRGILSTVRLVWPELMSVNLAKLVPVLKVPVYFVLGKHDHEAPSLLAEQYFNMLDSPQKELIWFENSAHLPNIEENDKFNNFMINHVILAVN